ncbi:MAG: HDIG domain-containing protein [Acidobacteria bacterium]|nr:HDIG domain-containing protein [Acidobacteriota bacterium]
MTGIYTYSVAILMGVAVFGAILVLMRLFHNRRLQSAQGVIQRLGNTALRDLGEQALPDKELREEELVPVRPSLFGIPYVAWISTSLFIPSAFLIIFFANLVYSYGPPDTGSVAWIAYRAPAAFQAQGRSLVRHELLIPKGKRITESDRLLVEEALRNRFNVPPGEVLGTLLILSVFIFILLYHINILYPTGTEKNKNLILIYLTILIVLVGAKISLFYGMFSPYLIPLPWAGMVITVFVNRRLVPLTMLITLIFVFLQAPFEFGLFLVLLSGGLVSGSWVRQARRRDELMFASLLVGLVMGGVFLCQSILNGHQLSFVLPDAVASLSNGVVAGFLTLLTLPAFERLFDFASPFRLMELLDLNTPVLSELFLKAPGTYQHTMAVASIAGKVANEIGANGLLVRVGAYYHDIGKMFNPQYFIENQVGEEDQHDELGPVASAAVIRSHVTLGIRLARRIGLPGPVEDFIPEHHGTSTIEFFYHKSRQQQSQIKSERVFKYSGPKPQSKETAVLMIVDSCEAACRVLKSRDEEEVRKLVSRMAYGKLEQREFDESGLTIGELQKIIDLLTDILQSAGHQRIAYPSDKQSRADESRQSKLRIVSQLGGSETDSST